MNYIHRIRSEIEALRAQLSEARSDLIDLEIYLTGTKFAGPDADYVHVRTDMLPKLSAIRSRLCQ